MQLSLENKISGLQKAFIFLASLAFGLRFGLNYGTSNQSTYLLHGVRLANPRLFRRDWLTTQTTDYHHFFSYLIKLLYLFDTTGWIFALANVAAGVLGGLLIYGLVREVAPRGARWAVYALTMATLMVTGTDSIGNSYLFSGVFQPSTLAVLGLLGALFYFLKAEYLLSGACLALGGFFHENYLILGLMLFFTAMLFDNPLETKSRWLRQFIFPLLVLAWYLPSLLFSASPQAQAGVLLWTQIRAPHHHLPSHFYKQYLPLLGWICLSLGLGWEGLRSGGQTRLKALLAALLLLIGLATFFSTAIFIPSVSLLFVWRLAPLADLLLLIAVGAAMAAAITGRAENSVPVIRRALIFAGAVLVGFYFARHQPWFPAFWILLAVLLAIQFKRGVRERFPTEHRPAWLPIGAILIWAIFSARPLLETWRSSTLLPHPLTAEEELYAWVRHSPADALYLTPPDLDGFRFLGQRAIVVDWKNTPSPPEMPEWYRRLRDEAGGDFKDLDGLRRGYAVLDSGRLHLLAIRYGCDYAVVRRGSLAEEQRFYPVVYANGEFVVVACK